MTVESAGVCRMEFGVDCHTFFPSLCSDPMAGRCHRPAQTPVSKMELPPGQPEGEVRCLGVGPSEMSHLLLVGFWF